MESYAGDAKLPLPRAMMRPALPLTARLMALKNKANDATARADIAALPGQLDRIDAWIADGLLGGEQPNAADLQIGCTIRLLHAIADLRPLIDGRPAARLTRYFPPSAGEIPAGVSCPRSGCRRRRLHTQRARSLQRGATVAEWGSAVSLAPSAVPPPNRCVPWTRSR